ncbi:MAG: carboxypeptidase regulatory-like domain-containing protein [Myxococcales bacterium]|nr:carboxypeptidase regulatory-like domain-containing protein [Myxococcales bacterium]
MSSPVPHREGCFPRWTRALLLAALTAAPAGQAEEGSYAHRDEPARLRAQLAYGLAARSSTQDGASLPLSYAGVSPSHLRLQLAYFPGESPFGLATDAAADWFRAAGPNPAGGPSSPRLLGLRAYAAGAARWLHPVGLSLEGQLGYGFGLLPTLRLAADGDVLASAVSHHGPVAQAAVGYDSDWLAAQLRARAMPFAFGLAGGGPSSLSQLGLGAEVAVGRWILSGLHWSAVLGYELESASGRGDRSTLSQSAHRVGLGVRAVLPRPSPFAVAPRIPTGPGTIAGTVLGGETPLAGVAVEVAGTGAVHTDAQGRFLVARAGPGSVPLKVSARGFKPLERSVDVAPESEAQLTLRLERPTGPGSIRGLVLEGKKPVPDVEVAASGAATVRSSADGTFLIAKAGPGPVSLALRAAGFKPAEELVAVAPETEATIEISLQREGAKAIASIKGVIRSVSGQLVPAMVRVPEAKAQAKAARDGSFHLRLPGGRYTVIIESDGFVTQTKVVEVADGDQAIFHVDLQPAR